jgi:hypothetical protein
MRVAMITPSSVAMPKRARKPTQTATLRLNGRTWKSSRRLCRAASIQEPRLRVQPQHQEAAAPGDEDAAEDHQRDADLAELEVEQRKMIASDSGSTMLSRLAARTWFLYEPANSKLTPAGTVRRPSRSLLWMNASRASSTTVTSA